MTNENESFVNIRKLVTVSVLLLTGFISHNPSANAVINDNPAVEQLDLSLEDNADALEQFGDKAVWQGESLAAIRFFLSAIENRKLLFDQDNSNISLRQKLAESYIKLADTLSPFAMFGDQRILRQVETAFSMADRLMPASIISKDSEAEVFLYFARYYEQQATHLQALGLAKKSELPHFVAVIVYHEFTRVWPEDPNYHRLLGLAYLALADTYPVDNNTMADNLLAFGLGGDLLNRYPKEEQSRIRTILAFELAVNSLEESDRLDPGNFRRECELKGALTRAAAAMQQIGFPGYARDYLDRAPENFCTLIDNYASAAPAKIAVAAIIKELVLDEVIPQSQRNGIAALERRLMGQLYDENSLQRHLSMWYATLGRAALLEAMNSSSEAKKRLSAWAVNALEHAVNLEIKNLGLNALLVQAYRVAGKHIKAQAMISDEPRLLSVNAYYTVKPEEYDLPTLQSKGLGVLLYPLVDEIGDLVDSRLSASCQSSTC